MRHKVTGRPTVVAIVTMLTVLLPVGPASTHPGPFVATFSGTASTGRLWAPFSFACPKIGFLCDDGPNIPWSFTSSTDAVVHPGSPAGLGSARVSGSGTLTGWCGRAVGTGTVTLKNPAGVPHTFQVTWQSAGSIAAVDPVGNSLVVLADISPPSRLVMIASVRAAGTTPANVKCIHSAATAFTIVGGATGLAG